MSATGSRIGRAKTRQPDTAKLVGGRVVFLKNGGTHAVAPLANADSVTFGNAHEFATVRGIITYDASITNAAEGNFLIEAGGTFSLELRDPETLDTNAIKQIELAYVDDSLAGNGGNFGEIQAVNMPLHPTASAADPYGDSADSKVYVNFVES